jgi:hypothetical protein
MALNRVTADRIAIFGDTPAEGNPAIIDYNVPLPGGITGRRLVQVISDLQAAVWLQTALDAGTAPAQQIPLTAAVFA